MAYKLKGGEEMRDGKLYGWTGLPCPSCKGSGEAFVEWGNMRCQFCGGTGEEWDLMPEQPTDLAESRSVD